MNLHLTRDEARIIQQFFLIALIEIYSMKYREAKDNPNSTLANKCTARAVLCLLKEISLVFDRKLRTEAKNFTFKFGDAHGLIFYQALMLFPIDASQVYCISLRQKITDFYYNQIILP